MGRGRRRVVVVLAVAVGVAASAGGLWAYMNHDRTGFIDHPEVVDAAESACREMRRRVADAGSAPSADERRSAENTAVRDMVDDIHRVGESTLEDDRPTPDWLDDWTRLAAAREAGEPVPQVDGEPISRRMDDLADDSGIEVCRIPPALLDADA